MTPTVLVTSMGSSNAISLVKSLRLQETLPVRIVGTDIHQAQQIAGSSFCDAFFTVPLATSPDYLPTLLDICKNQQVRVLYPIVDAEVEAIAQAQAQFIAQGTYPWVSSAEVVQTCNDKYQTYLFFKAHDFAMPPTWLPEQLGDDLGTLPYPLIMKPRAGRGSVGLNVVHDADELRYWLPRTSDIVIQQYIEGREFTIDVLCDAEHRVRAAVPRERLEVKAGVAFKAVTVRHEAMIRQAAEIARSLPIRGVCNIQCRLVEDKPIFFEINPRFPSALSITVAAGVNMPYLLLWLALGLPLDSDQFDFRAGVYMARYWQEVFYQSEEC